MKKFNQFREDSLLEVLKASDPTGKWIHDFVHSDNPKFAGKSKKERIRMALGAAYAAKRNEEVEGVAEGFDKEAEAYKAHLLKTAPKVMDFLSKAVKGWRPSKEEMLGAIDTGHMVMKHTGDVKQAGKAMMDELNTLHRMSQGQQGVAEAKDSREYDYEGDMAKSQLRSIMANAQRVHDMLEDDTNMAEWVQSKITLASDYISTVADYMQSEVKEEIENNHWYDAGVKDATRGARPKPRTYLPTLKDKQAKHPEEIHFYMSGYKSVKPGLAEGHYEDADDHLSKANDADAKGDKLAYHHHMADYHDSLSQWHEDKGRSASADKHAEKADYHSNKYTELARGVKEEVEPIEELSKDTIISYAIRANKDQDNQSTITGKAYLANDPKTANKAHHKFLRRAVGLDRAETRMNKEDTEVAEARMSAAQRLWNAEQKQRAKSDASLARTPSSIPKPEEKK